MGSVRGGIGSRSAMAVPRLGYAGPRCASDGGGRASAGWRPSHGEAGSFAPRLLSLSAHPPWPVLRRLPACARRTPPNCGRALRPGIRSGVLACLWSADTPARLGAPRRRVRGPGLHAVGRVPPRGARPPTVCAPGWIVLTLAGAGHLSGHNKQQRKRSSECSVKTKTWSEQTSQSAAQARPGGAVAGARTFLSALGDRAIGRWGCAERTRMSAPLGRWLALAVLAGCALAAQAQTTATATATSRRTGTTAASVSESSWPQVSELRCCQSGAVGASEGRAQPDCGAGHGPVYGARTFLSAWWSAQLESGQECPRSSGGGPASWAWPAAPPTAPHRQEPAVGRAALPRRPRAEAEQQLRPTRFPGYPARF